MAAYNYLSQQAATDVGCPPLPPPEGGEWGVWGEGSEAAGSPHSFTAKGAVGGAQTWR